MHSLNTSRTSPEARRRWAYRPSLARICTTAPADRAIWPPLPTFSSTLWMSVPTGMFRIGSAFPGLMSAPAPAMTVSPTDRPLGARMYLFSPSA